jgi:hypothetical protein
MCAAPDFEEALAFERMTPLVTAAKTTGGRSQFSQLTKLHPGDALARADLSLHKAWSVPYSFLKQKSPREAFGAFAGK